MWKALVVLASLMALGCGPDDSLTKSNSTTNAPDPTCDDGLQNGDEEGVDCGGDCTACEPEPTCDDGQQNGDEEGVDCGGDCEACEPEPTCDDGLQNGDEEGVDCGGDCAACEPAPTCDDGQQNGDEEGVDCGGPCEPCDGVPADWLCPASSYGDGQCDCGCDVVDEDCSSANVDACEATACPPEQQIDPDDNANCIDYPEAPLNPSFEMTPTRWPVVRQEGTSEALVVGRPQTEPPDGMRALRLTSTYDEEAGTTSPVEVESASFLPSGTRCDLTISMGDANVVRSNTDYGAIRVFAEGVEPPDNLLARLNIDTRGTNVSVAPTEFTYEDVTLSFLHSGEQPLVVNILGEASAGTLEFFVDDVRLDCR